MKLLEIYRCHQCRYYEENRCHQWDGGRIIDSNDIPKWCLLPDAPQENVEAEQEQPPTQQGMPETQDIKD